MLLRDSIRLAQQQVQDSVPDSLVREYYQGLDAANPTIQNGITPTDWDNVYDNATTLSFSVVSNDLGGSAVRCSIDGTGPSRIDIPLGVLPSGTYKIMLRLRGQGTNARGRLIDPLNATLDSQPLTNSDLSWTEMNQTMTVPSSGQVNIYVDFFSSTEAAGQSIDIDYVSVIPIESDGSAFVSVLSGISNIEEMAIRRLVIDLKNNSTWSKYHAIYPMVGGTAANHKWNLKDPRDLDAAFRITWSGTVTHDANGIKSDGSTGYGDTHLNPAVTLDANNISLGAYKTGIETDANGVYLGNDVAVTFLGWYSSQECGSLAGLNDIVPTTHTQKEGWVFVDRNASSLVRYLFNGSSVETKPCNGTLASRNIYVLACNSSGGDTAHAEDSVIKFAVIGDGLSDSEILADYGVVEAYQQTLGREQEPLGPELWTFASGGSSLNNTNSTTGFQALSSSSTDMAAVSDGAGGWVIQASAVDGNNDYIRINAFISGGVVGVLEDLATYKMVLRARYTALNAGSASISNWLGLDSAITPVDLTDTWETYTIYFVPNSSNGVLYPNFYMVDSFLGGSAIGNEIEIIIDSVRKVL